MNTTMTTNKLLAVLALILAILSFVPATAGYPLLVVAVILLALALIIV